MDFSPRKTPPRLKQDRIILHFDYDCFYAQVIEKAQPALKSVPLGIRQKSILATCNYAARARGVRKLQSVAAARALCPDLVLADGEDLSPFRDVSKRLYRLLRAHAGVGGSVRAERLGLDEVFLDVTDVVAYNVGLLHRAALGESFFCLSREDPEVGFAFDASGLAGCCVGGDGGDGQDLMENTLYVRLLLASHLARYLRLKVEEEGYTSACGIATSKLLSKLVGSVNKPRNQTTLLSLRDGDVLDFMDRHGLRQVPGLGGKTTHALEGWILGQKVSDADTSQNGTTVTVGQLRKHPDLSPQLLEKLLGNRPGSERGIGERIWGLLHGVDDSVVKAASTVPTQISIEDTYPGPTGGLNTAAEVERELLKLTASLLRRMHVDLVEDEAAESPTAPARSGTDPSQGNQKRRTTWLAHPKTLRLSTRPKTTASDGKPYNWGRASRSQPLPTFVFQSATDAQDQANVMRLVKETLWPMFAKLNQGSSGWNIGMLNICVANMVPTAADKDAVGVGKDISQMFKQQEANLREFQEYACSAAVEGADDCGAFADAEAESWDDLAGTHPCGRCGHQIPPFAMAAHQRYHDLGDE